MATCPICGERVGGLTGRRMPDESMIQKARAAGLYREGMCASCLARAFSPAEEEQARMQDAADNFFLSPAPVPEGATDLGLVTGYSARGQLLGHLVMGAQEAAEVARQVNMPEEKSVLLQHLILSHHGEPEFGAAVVPMCPEGELLSLIDKLDSRMEIYREELEKLQPGEVSRRIFALDKRIYRRAD